MTKQKSFSEKPKVSEVDKRSTIEKELEGKLYSIMNLDYQNIPQKEPRVYRKEDVNSTIQSALKKLKKKEFINVVDSEYAVKWSDIEEIFGRIEE